LTGLRFKELGGTMTKKRVARVQELIQEEIAELLLFKVKDPRITAVSITRVKMSSDLRRAVVCYSVFEDDVDRGEVQKGLESAAGFFRREVGRVVNLKFVPEIIFQFDRGLEYAQHMDEVLKNLGDREGSEPESDNDDVSG